jgi:acetyl esterase/lipase
MDTVKANQDTASWLVRHPLSVQDEATMLAMRVAVEPNKGKLQGVASRVPFDAIMERVSAPAGIVYEADTIGGVSGWWCRPDGALPSQVILHLHGGWFTWGSAQAFRHLAGHIAASARVATFVPDYRLAPEHPFPAAAEDARACYLGLIERGFTKIAVTGDSAGGNLALGLLVLAATGSGAAGGVVVGCVALSPVTDLTLSGGSWSTRAAADPYFTLPQAKELVRAYLEGHPPEDALASPLYAGLKGLPPLRVHVGNEEVLLDDSIRVAEQAAAAGVDVRLDVWQGMAHGYLGGVGKLAASAETLQLIGDFLTERFADASDKSDDRS